MKTKPLKPAKKAAKRTAKPKPQPEAATPAAPAPRKAKRAKRPGRTVDKMAAFLAAYVVCASIRTAARAAHINPRSHYDWLRDRPEYAPRFKQAKAEAAQSLEDEATRRAMVGVFEPNVFQGRWTYPQEEYEIEPAVLGRGGKVLTPAKIGVRDVPGSRPLGVWKKSDMLLALRLRAEMPERYRQYGSMELTGPGGGPIEIVQRLNAGRARVAAAKAAADAEAQAVNGHDGARQPN
jgi:hypothetical protein